LGPGRFKIHDVFYFQKRRDSKMKWFLVSPLIILAVSSFLCAENIHKIGLDNASTIGTRIETDTKVKVEGKGSIKITTAWPTIICLGEVKNLNIENAKLVYKAKVKTDLNGTAFLEMWCQVGGGQYFSKGMNSTAGGKEDWKEIETPFFLQAGQKAEKVTLNLVINGTGTVWVDDIVLSKEPLK
jgi:hypothetical protein